MAVTTQWLQNVAYAARIDRTLIDNLWTEGILGAGSFLVSERGAGTNMTVDVTAGVAVVEGDDQAFQGKYLCREQAATTGLVITTAPGSGTRHDLVVLQVQDPNAGGPAGDNAVLKVIAGATGNSTDPAVPDSALVLARVRVATGTTAITNAMIDDLRPMANAAGETSWTDLPLATGWTVPTGQRIRYKKVGDVVHVYGGALRTGGTDATVTIGELPLGFRPPANFSVSMKGVLDGDASRIQSDGLIRAWVRSASTVNGVWLSATFEAASV